jgi:hypothetical protein
MTISLSNYFHGSLASVGLSADSGDADIHEAAERELEELDELDDEHGADLSDIIDYLDRWVARERQLASGVA